MDSLFYIVPSQIPGRTANAIQVMKMGQALHDLAPGLQMVAMGGDNEGDTTALPALYGIDRPPPLSLLRARGRYGIHLFSARAALAAFRARATLVVTRSISAAALAARLGLPTVFECHAPPQGFERRYWRWLAGAPGFRRLVVISDSLRRLMLERHPEAAVLDIMVAPDGVDLARFVCLPCAAEAKWQAGRDDTRPIAGYAGHLYAGRGIEVILAVAERLPRWDFVIAGGTEADLAATRAELAQRTLTNVELCGFVPNAQLPERLAVCDVLLMPYQRAVMVSGGTLDTARWMSPLKMFEYMAMGRAIVSSDLPVLREVLDDSMARLVAPDDVAGWAAALSELESETARAPLARAARAAAEQYDWRRRCMRMLDGLWPLPVTDAVKAPCPST